MIKTSLMCFVLAFSLMGVGQNTTEPSDKHIMLGYFGETITHPGLTLGLEKQIGGSQSAHSLLTLSIGGYVHPRNNTSVFAQLQWGQRLFFKKGVFLEQFVGFGYLHQFAHGGDIYDVLPNGAVVKNKKFGQSKFKPSIALGIGYKFRNSGNMLFLRPEIFWKAPFNGYYLTHMAINIGAIIKMGN